MSGVVNMKENREKKKKHHVKNHLDQTLSFKEKSIGFLTHSHLFFFFFFFSLLGGDTFYHFTSHRLPFSLFGVSVV